MTAKAIANEIEKFYINDNPILLSEIIEIDIIKRLEEREIMFATPWRHRKTNRLTNETTSADTAAAGAQPMPGGGSGTHQLAGQSPTQRAKKRCRRCPPYNKLVDHADD